MSRGYSKRVKELRQVVEGMKGYQLLAITRTRNNHICCRICDKAGNVFNAFTGTSCSSDDQQARLNFRAAIRKQSRRLRGLCD